MIKTTLKLLCMLGLLIAAGCTSAKDASYAPSIARLDSSETLVMKFKACHWRCTQGTVKFKDRKAVFGRYSLDLTSKEISNLDGYFLEGKPLDSEWRCSLPIYISFKQRRGIFTINSKERLIYPCPFGRDENFLHPELLVRHFAETPTETPYWRLSEEEQNKKNILISPYED